MQPLDRPYGDFELLALFHNSQEYLETSKTNQQIFLTQRKLMDFRNTHNVTK